MSLHVAIRTNLQIIHKVNEQSACSQASLFFYLTEDAAVCNLYLYLWFANYLFIYYNYTAIWVEISADFFLLGTSEKSEQ